LVSKVPLRAEQSASDIPCRSYTRRATFTGLVIDIDDEIAVLMTDWA